MLLVWPALSSRMIGAPGARAIFGLTIGGSGSYSTTIASQASLAMYGSSAITQATSWPWKRTLSVASTAWVSYDRVGIQARLRAAIISPVSTRWTPGIAQALLTSIEVIRACA